MEFYGDLDPELKAEFYNWLNSRQVDTTPCDYNPDLGRIDLVHEEPPYDSADLAEFLKWRAEHEAEVQREVAEAKRVHAEMTAPIRRAIERIESEIGRRCAFCGIEVGRSGCCAYTKKIRDRDGAEVEWVVPYCQTCAHKHQSKRLNLQRRIDLLNKKSASLMAKLLRKINIAPDYDSEIARLDEELTADRKSFWCVIDGLDFLKRIRAKGYCIG